MILDVSVNHSGGHTVSIYKVSDVDFQGPSEDNYFTNLFSQKLKCNYNDHTYGMLMVSILNFPDGNFSTR